MGVTGMEGATAGNVARSSSILPGLYVMALSIVGAGAGEFPTKYVGMSLPHFPQKRESSGFFSPQ